MRPRREVLLLMAEEEQLGRWRLRLDLWGYRVHPFTTLDAALGYLSEWPVDAIATNVRGTRGGDTLAAGFRNVLLFDTALNLGPGHANHFQPTGPALVERVRENLQRMCARKRGPKKKPVQSVRPVESIAAFSASGTAPL